MRRKLHKEPAADSRDALTTDPTVWAQSMTDLKDVRDIKEIQFLAKLLGDISTGRLPEAVDLLTMRIREVRAAKQAGGSWEKASAISLQAQAVPANQALPDGAFVL